MCRIDSVPLPQHAEMRIAGRLLDTWQKVISDRIVELHFERSTDFGQDVECNAENTAGADSKRERIPCKFRFQIMNETILVCSFLTSWAQFIWKFRPPSMSPGIC